MNAIFCCSERFRERRMMQFLKLVERVQRPISLLDVGGTVAFWRGGVPDGISLTLINMFNQTPLKDMTIEVGDGCDLTRFKSQSFDIVFSNSVINLVGGWERQQQMASEIRRVGRRYFVQVPNRRFPLDWRTLVPLFHWLSPATQAWCLQRFSVGRYKKVQSAGQAIELASRVRDLTAAELHDLFPDGMIIPERVLGLTKSFMVHNLSRN